MDFKRLSQHRAQLLPLGGLLGERIEKSMALYGSQAKQSTEMSRSGAATMPVSRERSNGGRR